MKKRIMVLDDDVQVRESLRKLLEREGYEVILAGDGQGVFEKFEGGGIDLLLLDLNLPGKSGWDVFDHVTMVNPLMPIIVITGRDKQSELARAAGVGALMEKPLNVPVLLKTVIDLLSEPLEARLKRIAGVEISTRHVPPWSRLEPNERATIARSQKSKPRAVRRCKTVAKEPRL